MGIYETVFVKFENAIEYWLKKALVGNRRWGFSNGFMVFNNGMCGMTTDIIEELQKVFDQYPLKLSGGVFIESWSTYGPGVYHSLQAVIVNSVLYLRTYDKQFYYPSCCVTPILGSDLHYDYNLEMLEQLKTRIHDLPPKKDLLTIKN